MMVRVVFIKISKIQKNVDMLKKLSMVRENFKSECIGTDLVGTYHDGKGGFTSYK